MDFRFTQEQEMTAGVVRDLMAALCQPTHLRSQMANGTPRDANRWAKIAEMGLAGALVTEAAGGLGLQSTDFVLVAEACGYACLPEPLVEHAGVSMPLLAAAAPDHPALQRALDSDITIAVAHPANLFVADADTAGLLLVARQGELFVIDPADAAIVPQPSIDPFRRLFTVGFRPDASNRIAREKQAGPLLAAAFDRGALFAAAQLVGIAQRCIDLAVSYAKERQQFGKPIGSYQAVKHQLANAQVMLEFARPVVYAAAATLENADIYSRARISHAKLAASEAADLAARTAIQVHGAMGYSWEVDVHFFLKRAIALNTWWGAPELHRQRVAERALTGRLGPSATFASASDDD